MKQTQISAEVVAHSVNKQEDELLSVLCTFPRIILAEVNTHRMLSKNTSSSRAIPFNKMVETIQNDPFIPIAWQKEHKGMQGTEYLVNIAADVRNQQWLIARNNAVERATALSSPLHNYGGDLVSESVTKQLCNRLLEPFMWTTMLITGPKSGWENFFNLRCPSYQMTDMLGNLTYYKSRKDYKKDWKGMLNLDKLDEIDWLKQNKGQAEIHMMALAECIWDAYNESTPKVLVVGEWHIPFLDKIETDFEEIAVKVSTAMAARTSYTVVGEEKEIDVDAMVALHDRLLAQDPPHSSPLEHCARAMSKEEHFHFTKTRPAFTEEEKNRGNEVVDFGWCNNLKGFISYRYIVDNKINL